MMLSAEASISPTVEVLPVAPDMHHAVDRATATEQLAPWPVHASIARGFLRFDTKTPVEGVLIGYLRPANGNMDHRVPNFVRQPAPPIT